MAIAELVKAWQEEAEQLRGRYGADELARLCETHAAELEVALRATQEEELTLGEASRESGYSTSHLRAMIKSGLIPNRGRRGAPRLRRGDLPRKPAGETEPAEPRPRICAPAEKRSAPRGAFNAQAAAQRALRRA